MWSRGSAGRASAAPPPECQYRGSSCSRLICGPLMWGTPGQEKTHSPAPPTPAQTAPLGLSSWLLLLCPT